MTRKYVVRTYGCQMNERDSDAVSAMLRARGYRIVADENDCDVLLLNTCSVRDAADVSDHLNLAALSSVVEKHFLAYPK